jgi:transposase
MSFIRKQRRNGRTYLVEVENQRVGGKVKQKFIRYIGVDPDSNREAFPTCNDELSLDGVKLHGSVLVLDSIAKQLGLHELLGHHFAPILALVYCHCHDYKSVRNMDKWFNQVNFYKILGVDKITENDLHKGLEAIEQMSTRMVEKSIFETLKSKFDDSCEGVIYDVTNTYLRGGRSTLAKPGRDKEGVRGRNLVQVGLALTAQKGLPIFHQLHSGNTSDFKMFQEGIEDLKRFGIESGTIVYDRGMHAKDSILRLTNNKWKLIGGVPLHKGIKQFISNLDFEKFKNIRYRLQQGDSVVYAKTFPYQMGEVKGRLIVIINPKKKMKLAEERLNKIIETKESRSEIPKDMDIFFNKNGDINYHAIKRKEAYDGVSTLFVTGRITIKDAVATYFEKDLIEKSFMNLKSVLSLRPIRSWLDGKIEGHIFICYLSLVLLTTLRCLLDQKGKKGVKGLTAPNALEELQTAYMIEYSNKNCGKGPKKTYQKLVTLSNRQKNIMSAVIPNFKM